jgi:hypothetical protein
MATGYGNRCAGRREHSEHSLRASRSWPGTAVGGGVGIRGWIAGPEPACVLHGNARCKTTRTANGPNGPRSVRCMASSRLPASCAGRRELAAPSGTCWVRAGDAKDRSSSVRVRPAPRHRQGMLCASSSIHESNRAKQACEASCGEIAQHLPGSAIAAGMQKSSAPPGDAQEQTAFEQPPSARIGSPYPPVRDEAGLFRARPELDRLVAIASTSQRRRSPFCRAASALRRRCATLPCARTEERRTHTRMPRATGGIDSL